MRMGLCWIFCHFRFKFGSHAGIVMCRPRIFVPILDFDESPRSTADSFNFILFRFFSSPPLSFLFLSFCCCLCFSSFLNFWSTCCSASLTSCCLRASKDCCLCFSKDCCHSFCFFSISLRSAAGPFSYHVADALHR